MVGRQEIEGLMVLPHMRGGYAERIILYRTYLVLPRVRGGMATMWRSSRTDKVLPRVRGGMMTQKNSISWQRCSRGCVGGYVGVCDVGPILRMIDGCSRACVGGMGSVDAINVLPGERGGYVTCTYRFFSILVLPRMRGGYVGVCRRTK